MVNIYKADLDKANDNVEKETRKGFWIKLLTFGLLSNDDKIADANIHSNKCRSDFNKYLDLMNKANDLDSELNDTIIVNGARVSKNTFTDIKLHLTASYPIDWENLRKIVLSRDLYRCQEIDAFCNGPLQIHHKIPLSKGGANDVGNLITLCHFHHSQKHDHMRNNLNGYIRS